MNYLNKKYIYMALLSLILGCEEVDIVEIELEHQEKIVVQSELIANEFFSGVSLTKTLPLNEIYSIEKAEITDALAFLIVDATKIIPLHYRENGNYESLYPFKIKSDETYELYASINDEEIYSITKVPQIPIVNSERYVADGYLSASVQSNVGEAYGAIWIITPNELSYPSDQANDFYSISNTDGSSSNRTLAVRTTKLSNNYLDPFFSDKLYMQVYSFDTAYLDYFYTKNNNNPIEDSFSQGGAPIKWNIRGENTIGMFIGFAKSDFIKINR
jgi:Domain of unknown function (DUF4249)